MPTLTDPKPAGRTRCLLVALALLSLGGCGGRLESPGYSVSGTVTWKGQPLDQGDILFTPATGQGGSVGGVIHDGEYVLPNPPGLNPGMHRVRIVSRSGVEDRPGVMGDLHLMDPHSKERIPKAFNEDTTLQAEVKAGESNVFPFALD